MSARACALLAAALAFAAAGCLQRDDPEVVRQRAVIETLTRKSAEQAIEIERLRRELAAERARRDDTTEKTSGGVP